jgi:competence protein ComEC
VIVIWLTLAWLAGILLASAVSLPWPLWLGWGLGGLLAALPLRYRPGARLGLLLIAGLGFGGLRLVLSQPIIDPGQVSYYNGAEVTIRGVVTAEPELRPSNQRLTVAVEAIALASGATRAVEGQLLVTVPRYPAIAYGARVRLIGALEEPPILETFNYRDYLARRGVRSIMRLPEVTIEAEEVGQQWRAGLLAFKARAQASINRLVPEPEASLLSGILLGNDAGLPASLQEAFRATGMSHIIAISGFNISLLAGGVTRLATPLIGKRRSAWLALVAIALYTALVGADAAVVRAAIMGGLYLTGNRLLGRPLYARGTLFSAAFLMTVANPLILWDVGFQLSFAATLGLMLYADRFHRWTSARLTPRLPERVVGPLMGFLSDAVLVTLAAQLATLPLMLAVFDQVSIISLVANPLILPAQAGVMLLGGLATGLGMVAPALAQPVAWAAWLLLKYTTSMVALLGAVPWAAVPLALEASGAILLYGLIGAGSWFLFQPAEERREMAARWLPRVPASTTVACGLMVVIMGIGWGRSQPDGLLHVTLVPAALGDAALIQSPTGRTLLVTGLSATGGREPLMPGKLLPFWQRRLDALVLASVDEAALAGVPEVLARYRVERLLIPSAVARQASLTDRPSLPG